MLGEVPLRTCEFHDSDLDFCLEQIDDDLLEFARELVQNDGIDRPQSPQGSLPRRPATSPPDVCLGRELANLRSTSQGAGAVQQPARVAPHLNSEPQNQQCSASNDSSFIPTPLQSLPTNASSPQHEPAQTKALSSDSEGVAGPSLTSKQQARMERNREHAHNSRVRKKMREDELGHNNEELKRDNAFLRGIIAQLTSENAQLKQQLGMIQQQSLAMAMAAAGQPTVYPSFQHVLAPTLPGYPGYPLTQQPLPMLQPVNGITQVPVVPLHNGPNPVVSSNPSHLSASSGSRNSATAAPTSRPGRGSKRQRLAGVPASSVALAAAALAVCAVVMVVLNNGRTGNIPAPFAALPTPGALHGHGRSLAALPAPRNEIEASTAIPLPPVPPPQPHQASRGPLPVPAAIPLPPSSRASSGQSKGAIALPPIATTGPPSTAASRSVSATAATHRRSLRGSSVAAPPKVIPLPGPGLLPIAAHHTGGDAAAGAAASAATCSQGQPRRICVAGLGNRSGSEAGALQMLKELGPVAMVLQPDELAGGAIAPVGPQPEHKQPGLQSFSQISRLMLASSGLLELTECKEVFRFEAGLVADPAEARRRLQHYLTTTQMRHHTSPGRAIPLPPMDPLHRPSPQASGPSHWDTEPPHKVIPPEPDTTRTGSHRNCSGNTSDDGPSQLVSILLPAQVQGASDGMALLTSVQQIFVVVMKPAAQYLTFACELTRPVFVEH